MYQARYGSFISAAVNGTPQVSGRSVVGIAKRGKYTDTILRLLGVKYIVYRKSDGRPDWVFPHWEYPVDRMRMIYSDSTYEVFEYEDALPRAFLSSSYQIVTEDSKITQSLFSPGFNRKETLILEHKPGIEPEKGDGTISIESYKPNEVIINTGSSVDKLLFLSDVYDKGWKATIDGKSTPIYRADYDFRAVALPKGNHVVHFYYQPDIFIYAIGISLISCIIFAIISFCNYENRFL